MNYISAALRQQVVQRAAGRCEYCRLSQQGQEATFHIDHVMPVARGGKTHLDNLALACVSCSLRKAARLDAIDPKVAAPFLFTIHAANSGKPISAGKPSA